MAYRVKEIFLSLQGEGLQAGRRAVFCRFAGCNGWSGREEDRGKGPLACSSWCDTDFVGTDGVNGGRYDAVALARLCSEVWGEGRERRFVVLTGGEPALQADAHLVDVLHRWEFEVAIETNGTRACPSGLDWITVSPKPGLSLVQTEGQELKLVYPQADLDPSQYASMGFGHFVLQPLWVESDAERQANVESAIQYCMAHPRWQLGLQMHKAIGLR